MIARIERHTFGVLRDAGIAGCAIELLHQRACRHFPGQRMFAAAGAEQEDIHTVRNALFRGGWCSMRDWTRKRIG